MHLEAVRDSTWSVTQPPLSLTHFVSPCPPSPFSSITYASLTMTRPGGSSSDNASTSAGTSTPTSSIPGPSSSTRTAPLAGPSSLPTSTSGSTAARRVSQAAASASPFVPNRRATASSSGGAASASAAPAVAAPSSSSAAPASSSQHLPPASLAADLYGFNNGSSQSNASHSTSTATPTPTGYANYWRAAAPTSAQPQQQPAYTRWGNATIGSPRVGGHSLSHSVGTNSPARPSTGAQSWATGQGGGAPGGGWTLADPAGWSGDASMATAARAFEENSVTVSCFSGEGSCTGAYASSLTSVVQLAHLRPPTAAR